MLRRLIIVALGCLAVPGVRAATPQEDFNAFRRSIHQDFGQFRSEISRRYAGFLSEAWAEYKGALGVRPPEGPKPPRQPLAPVAHPAPAPQPLPAPAEVHPRPHTVHTPAQNPPVRPQKPVPALRQYDSFSMSGVPLRMPHIGLDIRSDIYSQDDFASQWQSMASSPGARGAIEAVQTLAADYGLNDYLTFLALVNWARENCPAASARSRMSLVHFLLVGCGIDARIALSDKRPLILLPSEVKIYSRSYCDIDGRRYYFFSDDPDGRPFNANFTFNTCRLPDDARGRACDFLIHGLKPPMKAATVDFSSGKLRLKGTLNANIMPWVYRYPHMEMGAYEMSELDADFRKEILNQTIVQLRPLDEVARVNTLLSFIQYAFKYATDGDAHGFEKPYFVEETFFLPSSDCEDRSILFVWLAEKALRHKCQLIGFPGHEAAGIRLSATLKGDYYTHDGKRYYIADPTYQGAGVGRCMDQYRGVAPTIDYTTP